MKKNYTVKIIGGKSSIIDINEFIIKIHDFAEKYDLIIQVFNADMIYGKIHILSSIEHAIRAMKNNTMTTNSIDKELILYTAGERQLKIAIPKMGVKKGNCKIVFIFLKIGSNDSKDLNKLVKQFINEFKIKQDNSLINGSKKVLANHGITEIEIETIPDGNYCDLILEKIALVDIIK
jgi:tRNA threonylcarbamoyladenosine modification (KEOPS) complex Cgi121 subunit